MFGLSSSSNRHRPKLNGPDIASMTSPGPKYQNIRGYNHHYCQEPTRSEPSYRITYNPNASTRAAAGLKWGVTPRDDPPPHSPPGGSFSEEEQAERPRLRAKGINPDSKAERDEAGNGKEKDGKKRKSAFWTKVARTSMGGGWIKSLGFE